MGVKLIAPNRRDLMVSLALHYKDIIVVQIFLIGHDYLHKSKARNDLDWPLMTLQNGW